MPSFLKALREVASAQRKLKDDPRVEIRKVRPKAFPTDGTGGGDFEKSPYDFEEVDNLIDTDGYARQSTARMMETFFKEGYDLKGPDPEAVTYIEQRFRVIGIAMNQSWDDFMYDVASDLIDYHNVFLAKTRDIRPQQITGLPYQGVGGKDPVAAYTQMPVETVSIKRDEKGILKKYKQIAGSNQKEFNVEDVIHGKVRNKTGTLWGKPDLLVAVEDLISFRIIEQDALNLVHKEMYPTYVYYVGDDLRPAEDEDLEVAASRLEDMQEVGGLVAPGKDTVDIIGSEKTLDVQKHIEHFKERGIIALGVSPYQIGITAGINNSLAESLDTAFFDKVKNYQRKLENLVNEQMIFELLLEGGFDPIGLSGDSQMVTLRFKEIDVEAQIKRENHVSTLFLENMIKHGEMRADIGRNVDPEFAELYFNDAVAIPLAMVTGNSEGGENTSSPAKGTAKSKNNPANDKGNRGGPKMKAAASDRVDEALRKISVIEEKLSNT